ncbi:MAG: (d)CMP kinase [Dorea sp.]|nr:(d)CMP kinase [Dorea sp.]
MAYNIAIDGPAGAGKSTIAKIVAKEMGFNYVDTGAMFRGLAILMLDTNTDITDLDAVQKVLDETNVSVRYEDGSQQIYLGENNVTSRLRAEEVGKMASNVAKLAPVRSKLLDIQRQIAASENIVMDGRDIGTVVLPDADVKIFLTASSRERALRRYRELTEKNESCDLEQIEKDIIERDYQDSHRKIAPLAQADDAKLIDSSHMTIMEVVDHIISECK